MGGDAPPPAPVEQHYRTTSMEFEVNALNTKVTEKPAQFVNLPAGSTHGAWGCTQERQALIYFYMKHQNASPPNSHWAHLHRVKIACAAEGSPVPTWFSLPINLIKKLVTFSYL